MKKTFILLLSASFLVAGMTSCKKDKAEPTPEEQAQEVAAALEGKWERQTIQVDGYKDGKLVTANIDDEEIIAGLAEDFPSYMEFTKTKFAIVDPDDNTPGEEVSYTIDAVKGTILLQDGGTTDDNTLLKYSLTDKNNTLALTLDNEGALSDQYDSFQVKLGFKRISEFPAVP